MSIFNNISFFKKRKIIKRENEVPYLIRWNLFECPAFSIKIHKILRSDYDCLHDHPWAFLSFILRGGYVEHRDIPIEPKPETVAAVSTVKNLNSNGYNISDMEWLGYNMTYFTHKRVSKIVHPGSIIYRKAEDRHKLEIHQPALTLVITFKKTRQWGFWTKQGWVPFFKYNSNNHCE